MLAPMQDITTLPFMRMLARRGAPDFFVTEFLRVNATSQIDDSVAECAEKTLPLTGTPLLVQLIGEDVPALVRVARRARTLSRNGRGNRFEFGLPDAENFSKKRRRRLASRFAESCGNSRRVAQSLFGLRKTFHGEMSARIRRCFAVPALA